MFRVLSFDVLSSDRALDVVHDAFFGFMALSIALLCVGFGWRGAVAAAIAGAAVLLNGPLPLHRAAAPPLSGFMYSNYVVASFRPHVPLAGLLLVGVAGAIYAASRGARRTPTLLLSLAMLSLSDEASSLLVAFAVGVAWLADAKLLAETRARGLLVFVAVGAAAVLPSVLFGGSLAPSGSPAKLTWVKGQVPPTDSVPILPLASWAGATTLFIDALPILLAGFGVLLAFRRGRSLGPFALGAGVLAAAIVLATHTEVNGVARLEVQRWWVAPFFLAFVPALAELPRMPQGSLARVAVVAGVGVPAVFTSYWQLDHVHATYKRDHLMTEPAWPNVYDVDCRDVAGAHLGDRAVPTYVEMSVFWLYSTCRGLYTPGNVGSTWPVNVFPRIEPRDQLGHLETLVGSAPLPAICRANPKGMTDPVCLQATRDRSRCTEEGRMFVRCVLPKEERALIFGR
jgi:hypothetical protein